MKVVLTTIKITTTCSPIDIPPREIFYQCSVVPFPYHFRSSLLSSSTNNKSAWQ